MEHQFQGGRNEFLFRGGKRITPFGDFFKNFRHLYRFAYFGCRANWLTRNSMSSDTNVKGILLHSIQTPFPNILCAFGKPAERRKS